MKTLLVEIPTATNQVVGRQGDPAGFLVHVSKSNLNNLESTLKKLNVSEFKYDAKSVQVTRVLVVIV